MWLICDDQPQRQLFAPCHDLKPKSTQVSPGHPNSLELTSAKLLNLTFLNLTGTEAGNILHHCCISINLSCTALQCLANPSPCIVVRCIAYTSPHIAYDCIALHWLWLQWPRFCFDCYASITSHSYSKQQRKVCNEIYFQIGRWHFGSNSTLLVSMTFKE